MTHPLHALADAKAIEYGPRYMAGTPLAVLLREYGAEVLRLAREPSEGVQRAAYAWCSDETKDRWCAGIDALLREVEG